VIGADSLAYLNVERLGEMIGGKAHCTGCFTGKYPMEPPQEDIRGSYEK
jgi:amidophosphoribosyltransferase